MRRSSSRTTTSTSRPRFVRAARPDAKLAHFVHIPWPVDWTILPEAMRRAVHDGLLANDVVGFHTARWARNFEASCAEIAAAAADARHAPRDLDRHRRVRRARDSRTDVLAEESELEATRPEKLVAPRRPHRPVEEHRARPRGVRRPARHSSGVARPRHGCSRCSIRHGSRSPSTSTYVAAIERTTDGCERAPPAARSSCSVADDFPQSVAAYKQFDVLLVNAVYDGMNLVAKEAPLVNAPRRRAHPVRERRCARGARRTGR